MGVIRVCRIDSGSRRSDALAPNLRFGYAPVAQTYSHAHVAPQIRRSREGLKAVARSVSVIAVTAAIEVVVYISTGSIALLADLIHNFAGSLTAVPIACAFIYGSRRADYIAGIVVVSVILASAAYVAYEAVAGLIHPDRPHHLLTLALAGIVGFAGNAIAAAMRRRSGRRLDSPALVAAGNNSQADAYLSLSVTASAAGVALGFGLADPLIGLAIALIVFHITWTSWRTVHREEAAAESG